MVVINLKERMFLKIIFSNGHRFMKQNYLKCNKFCYDFMIQVILQAKISETVGGGGEGGVLSQMVITISGGLISTSVIISGGGGGGGFLSQIMIIISVSFLIRNGDYNIFLI